MAGSIPMLHYVASASAALPLVAMIRRRSLRQGGGWLALACMVSLGGDALGLYLSARGLNNHWLAYLVTPLLFSSILFGLGVLQHTAQERAAFRITAVLMLFVSAVLAVVADDLLNFSKYSLPLGSLLVLGASVWTLVRGGFPLLGGLPEAAGWFWIPGGFAVYAAVTAAYLPLIGDFTTSDREFVDAVLRAKSILVIIAFTLVSWGILCQDRPTRSGRSSSPSSSPLASS